MCFMKINLITSLSYTRVLSLFACLGLDFMLSKKLYVCSTVLNRDSLLHTRFPLGVLCSLVTQHYCIMEEMV